MTTQNLDYSNLPIGTKIYYTGDMANVSGFGFITGIIPADKYISKGYEITMEDGSVKKHISPLNFSHPDKRQGQRFQVNSERAESYKKHMEAMRIRLEEMRAKQQ